MNVSYDGVLHLAVNLSNNLKSAILIFRRVPAQFFIANKASQFGLADRISERLKLATVAFGNQFYAPVRQVFYRSSHFKTMGDHLRRVTESYPLDSAGIKDVQPLPPHFSPMSPSNYNRFSPFCIAT